MIPRSVFFKAGIWLVIAIITAFGDRNATAANPECAGTGPFVCVFKDGTDPVVDEDFFFDFTDPANPDVALKTGNAGWRVWSQVSSSDTSPANFGTITINNQAALDADFGLDITNPDTSPPDGPGAADVGSINLVHPDEANWTGHSSITAGWISKSLKGDLRVVQDSSEIGGEVDLTISLQIEGNVTIPVVRHLQSAGFTFGTSGNLMQIGEVACIGPCATPGLEISGFVIGSIEIGTLSGILSLGEEGALHGEVTIDVLTGQAKFLGDVFVARIITVKSVQTSSPPPAVLVGDSPSDFFAGTLKFPNGVPSGSSVSIVSEFEGTTGAIDFVGEDNQPKDLMGDLTFSGPVNGEVRNIATLGGGIVMNGPFGAEGTVAMRTLSGSITVNDDFRGGIEVSGLIDGTIDVSGAYSGDICADNVTPGGPFPANLITLTSIDLELGGTLCTFAINCLTDGDCGDSDSCTNDLCIDNFCWNPCTATCEETCPPGTARPYLAEKKNRYLVFDPGNTAVSVAFDVTLTDAVLFPDEETPLFLGWVGQPNAESGISRVVDDPYFNDSWPSVIQLADCEIVPAATYEIRATTEETPPYTPFSPALVVQTIDLPLAPRKYGDVVGDLLLGLIYGPPNGSTNFNDVLAIIEGFRGDLDAPPKSWLDVHDECPNGVINFEDTFLVIKAWMGDPYPYSAPSACPDCEGRATGDIDFLMVADNELIYPNEQVVIDVFVEPATDVGVYQVSLEVTGGDTGSLDVTSMNIDKARPDYIFASSSVADAVDNVGGRLGAGLSDGTGVDVTAANDYLGTFTLTASPDASGDFEVKVRSIDEAFLSDSNVESIGTSSGVSLFIQVNCEVDTDCDDGNGCTVDTCVSGVCTTTNEPVGTTCDDGLFCTKFDSCDGAATCVGSGSPCKPSKPYCCEYLSICTVMPCI